MSCPCTIVYTSVLPTASLSQAESVRAKAKVVIANLITEAVDRELVLDYTGAASIRRKANRLNLVSKAAVLSPLLRAELIREAKELITLYGI